MSHKNKGIFWMVITLLIAQCIFGFSNQTSQQSSSMSIEFAKWLVPWLDLDTAHFLIRKLAHFTIYTALGFSFFRSMQFFKPEQKRLWLFCFLIIVVYAGLDEFHQLFIDGRSGELRDIFIDSCGGFLGIQVNLWLKKIVKIDFF